MNDPRDQVLEHALRKVFAAPHDDLSWRVVSSWRGTRAVAPRVRAVRSRSWMWIAAAGVAAAGLFLLEPWGDASGVLATADAPVLATARGEWSPAETVRPVAGQTVVTDRRPARLTLSDGSRVRLAAATLLRFAAESTPPDFVLLHGDVELSCSDSRSLRVAVGQAAIDLSPGARLRVRALAADAPYRSASRPFLGFAEDLHMNHVAPAAVAAITLFSGAAVLTDARGAQNLPQGQTVQSPPRDAWGEALAKHAGTWDLAITDFRGQESRKHEGTEVCRVPSGGKWLFSDTTATRHDGSPMWQHWVLGFSARNKQWRGSLVDSFGGPIGVLGGPMGDDPKVWVLTVGRIDGSKSGIRMTMRWVSDDERHSLLEIRNDGEWQRVREIVHRRRE